MAGVRAIRSGSRRWRLRAGLRLAGM